MKPLRRKFLHLAAGAVALPAMSRIAWAQAYPSRPVRIIVGYAAGGGLEVALTQNIFVRGEYEFIDFQRPWQIATTMHNFRAGLGVRF